MTDVAYLAEEIFAHGVSQLFGVPGSGITLSLIDALERKGIPFHLTHFEGAGALMAATAGRLSGRAGVSLSIKGPGLANAVPGIAAAWFEAFPLVHLAEALAPDSSAGQAHKRLNQANLISSITKAARFSAQVGPSFAAMAEFACAEQPEPVLLELAGTPQTRAEPLPALETIEVDAKGALDLIKQTQKPVVIAGTLALRQGLGGQLQKLNCPIFSTAAAKGVIDERDECAAGVYTGVGLSLTPEQHLLPKADLVVGIGLTAREVLAAKPFPCPYVAVDAIDTPGVSSFSPTARMGLTEVDAVLDALATKAWGLDELKTVLTEIHARMLEGFLPGAVFHALEQHYGPRVRLVMDTGYFCTIGEHAWRAPSADLCLFSGQGRYMGTGLPMALGAALHDRSVPTVLASGDGGIAMYLAEAKLAARHKLPLLIVLMTDNAFGSIRTRAIKVGLTQRPLFMDGKSWVPAFDALGIPGTRAESLVAVKAALTAWKPESGPAFLEIPFEPDAYEAMVAGIR